VWSFDLVTFASVQGWRSLRSFLGRIYFIFAVVKVVLKTASS
jgi:hypothetical protein